MEMVQGELQAANDKLIAARSEASTAAQQLTAFTSAPAAIAPAAPVEDQTPMVCPTPVFLSEECCTGLPRP